MNIAICGPGGCGKDTVAGFFAVHGGFVYTNSTSYTASSFVYNEFVKTGVNYDDPYHCYMDRRYHREFWADAIVKYNAVDSVALYRDHLKTGQQILTGVRKLSEIRAVKEAGLCQLLIWIHNPRVKDGDDPTQEYGPQECDITIINDDLAITEKRVKAFCGMTLQGIFHNSKFKQGAACRIRKPKQ